MILNTEGQYRIHSKPGNETKHFPQTVEWTNLLVALEDLAVAFVQLPLQRLQLFALLRDEDQVVRASPTELAHRLAAIKEKSNTGS